MSNIFMAEGHTHYWGPVSRSHVGKTTIIGVPNHLNYCVIFILHTYSTGVTAGCIIQRGWPHVGDPWSRSYVYIQWKIQKTAKKNSTLTRFWA